LGIRGTDVKIGIPIWNERISPVMDTASTLLVVELDGDREISRTHINLENSSIWKRILLIRDSEIDVLICGAISRPFLDGLRRSRIQVLFGIMGKVQDVLDAFLEGRLFHPKFFMPGFNGNCYRYGFRNIWCKRRNKGEC